MKNIAVITGGSTGLGAELLKIIPKQYPEIQEIWAIQRRSVRPELTTVPLRSITMDLTKSESYAEFEQLLINEQPNICLLINNAGMGKIGDVLTSNYASQAQMVDLNVRAITAITTLCLGYMKRGADILNIASIAAFAPTPRMAVYSSTKAFVLSFSRALREELKPKDIHCMAVCPGPMSTEFLPVAGIEKGTSRAFDTLPYCYPAAVAKNAILMLKKGHAVYTPKFFYKVYRILAKLLPHNLIIKISKT